MSGAAYDEIDEGVAHVGQAVTQRVAEMNNPFARAQAQHINAGSVAIESDRAIAEAQGKLLLAKRFPRDEAAAYARIMQSCKRPGLAQVSAYAYKRGGGNVTGPSIRLAEEMVRCFGNVDYGIRELSRRHGESEMQAYAWDLETNVISTQNFTVRHIRDTQGGGKTLTEERDIYEITANMGARRLRARILAILPPDMVEAAVAECRKTRDGNNKLPFADQVKAMGAAFATLGVTSEMLVAKLGHSLDATTPDELGDLRDIYTTIKDGVAKASEFFGNKTPIGDAILSRMDALKQAATGQAGDTSAPTPTPAPSPPATDDPTLHPDAKWLIEQMQAAADAHAFEQLLESPAIRAKAKALSAEDRKPVVMEEAAIREGFKRERAAK